MNSLPGKENVARAIFSPMMIDDNGHIQRAAFMLRHNEDYISVCRMAIDSWHDDMLMIPQNSSRLLFGYAVMNVGEVRQLAFYSANKKIGFDVVEKQTERNRSHAGIVISLDGSSLKGDKVLSLKPVPSDVSVDAIIMRYQKRLANLAQKGYTQAIKNTL